MTELAAAVDPPPVGTRAEGVPHERVPPRIGGMPSGD
jgi:hypothetical protein